VRNLLFLASIAGILFAIDTIQFGGRYAQRSGKMPYTRGKLLAER
jgi:hypothetical protein